MKKISEWLNELPEPYRTAALNNQQEFGLKIGLIDSEAHTLSGALAKAFEWGLSPEKYQYWDILHSWIAVNRPQSEWPKLPGVDVQEPKAAVEQYVTKSEFDRFADSMLTGIDKLEKLLSAQDAPKQEPDKLTEDEELERCWQKVKYKISDVYPSDDVLVVEINVKDWIKNYLTGICDYWNTPKGKQTIAYIKMQVIAQALNEEYSNIGGKYVIKVKNGAIGWRLLDDEFQTADVIFTNRDAAELAIINFPSTCRDYCGVNSKL